MLLVQHDFTMVGNALQKMTLKFEKLVADLIEPQIYGGSKPSCTAEAFGLTSVRYAAKPWYERMLPICLQCLQSTGKKCEKILK